jgi:hypothetical protein
VPLLLLGNGKASVSGASQKTCLKYLPDRKPGKRLFKDYEILLSISFFGVLHFIGAGSRFFAFFSFHQAGGSNGLLGKE